MKNIELGVITLTLCGFGMILVMAGCQDPTQQEVTAASNANETKTTSVSVNDSASDGCCGKCKAEAEAEVKQKACCGKCADASVAKKEGGCGNCQDEIPSEENSAGCSGDCNACAEGDAENCRCEDEATENTTNSHVNSMREDRDIFHYLLKHHEKITRSVTNIETGVQTTTESDDPAIAAKIKEHVDSMHGRIKDVRRLRNWDDLFVKIFEHADEIDMKVVHTEKGVKVVETSDNPHVVKLIQQHAVVVSGFAKYGFEEAHKNHPVENAAEEN